MKYIKRIIGNLTSAKAWEFYWNLMFPRDDYYLRYFGHQYGSLERVKVEQWLPEIKKTGEILIREFFSLVPGTSLEGKELLILIAVLKLRQVQAMCEIGTANGITSLNVAANLPNLTITTIDLPLNYEPDFSEEQWLRPNNVTDRSTVGMAFESTIYEKRIIQIYDNSLTMNWSRFDSQFDCIFIDACHEYDAVKSDSRNALRFLKSGGMIIWHDYGQSRGVSKYIDELSTTIPITAIEGTRFAMAVDIL